MVKLVGDDKEKPEVEGSNDSGLLKVVMLK
jgi:hypothetical protein